MTKTAIFMANVSPRDYLDGIAEWQAWPIISPVSVLDFSQISKNGNAQLIWKVRSRDSVSGDIVTMPAIHVEEPIAKISKH